MVKLRQIYKLHGGNLIIRYLYSQNASMSCNVFKAGKQIIGVLMNTALSTNRKFKGIPAHILRICALLTIVLANTTFPARAAQKASAPVLPLASGGGLDTPSAAMAS
jgi:hypothetical protein